MNTPPFSFKRLVLGLQSAAPDRMLRLAVELAEQLHLELLGVFLEDTSLRDLAGLPFARELRPLNGGWHAIDLERVSEEVERTARNVERMFAAATKGLMTQYRFDIMRGPLVATLMSVSRAGDIVVLFEPAHPAERASQQFAWLVEGAFRSAAAVMIVPPRILRTAGPVAVIAERLDDPSLDAAVSVARAAQETLVWIDLGTMKVAETDLQARSAALGCPIARISLGPKGERTAAALVDALYRTNERLVVVTRGVVDERVNLALASMRGVPVLVIEPRAVRGEPAL